MSEPVLLLICFVAGWYCAKWSYVLSGLKKERKNRKILAQQTLAVETALARRYEREAK